MTLDAIRGRDPAFDQTRFLARAEAVLALVLRARAEARPDEARAVVSDDMAMRLRAELAGQRSAGRRQVHAGVRVRAAEIIQAAADDRRDTIAVRFALEGAAYEADTDGRPVEGATRERRRWAEVWWFQRKAGTTTSEADAPVDRCPGCGAPVAPTSEGACAYCQRPLADSSTWILTRVSDAASGSPDATASGTDAAPAARVARTVGVLLVLVVLVVMLGGVSAGFVLLRPSTPEALTDSRPEGPSTPGSTLPPGVTPQADRPATTTTTGFVTPVANPRVLAPVNDVVAAAAAVQAKVGRPVMASSIHLYPDGRIIFELQAADDPKGVDSWLWKGGTVTGPEQGLIGVDPTRLYPLAGLDLSNLARLCDAAIGATGIADGTVDSPYLLKIGTGLRWYVPVQSESRSSNRKTYRVAPNGSKPEVF